MKRIFYNNLIARLLTNCHTITLGPFILTKKKNKNELGQVTINHETCHSIQWVELFVLTVIAIFMIQMFFNISSLWYIISLVSFYIWYIVEYFIRLLITRNHKEAYRSISFEKEAYENEKDSDYIENRPLLSWIDYI